MTADASLNYGGGNTPYFTNSGTLQKTSGTGLATVTADGAGNFNFIDTNTSKFHYRFYRTSN